MALIRKEVIVSFVFESRIFIIIHSSIFGCSLQKLTGQFGWKRNVLGGWQITHKTGRETRNAASKNWLAMQGGQAPGKPSPGGRLVGPLALGFCCCQHEWLLKCPSLDQSGAAWVEVQCLWAGLPWPAYLCSRDFLSFPLEALDLAHLTWMELLLFFVTSVVKNPPANAGDTGLIPDLGRSPGGGNGNPLQYSCLGNPMDGGAWWATVCGVTKSWTRLSD